MKSFALTASQSTFQESITIWRGEDAFLTFTMDVQPTSISGWTIVFNCRQSFHGTSPALFTVPATITDSVNGVFTVTLPSSQTNRPHGHYVYDVTRTDSGASTELAVGDLTIKSGVRLN